MKAYLDEGNNGVIKYAKDSSEFVIPDEIKDYIAVNDMQKIHQTAQEFINKIGGYTSGSLTTHNNGDSINDSQFETLEQEVKDNV